MPNFEQCNMMWMELQELKLYNRLTVFTVAYIQNKVLSRTTILTNE